MEYKLPMSSKRVDVVLAGQHPETDEPSHVVVELKQWSEAKTQEFLTHLVNGTGVSTPVIGER